MSGFPNSSAGGIDQLTSDVTAGPGTGSQVATLATVTTAETVGDSAHYPIVTTDAKGRVTGLTAQALPAGVSPATTVTGPDAYGAVSAVGTSTLYARQDHDHGLPAAPSPALTSDSSYITATVTLVASTPTNLTSLSLGAGTWLIHAQANVLNEAAATMAWGIWITTTSAGAGTTAITGADCDISENSAGYAPATTLSLTGVITLSGTTTVYLVSEASQSNAVIQYHGYNYAEPNITGMIAVKIA